MKKSVLAALIGVAVLAVIQGCGVLGGPPTGVAVSAGPDNSDSTVVISWTTPAEGSPDKYMVYFRPVADSGFAALGETTGISYVHNPHGMTGQYRVSAVFGGESFAGAEQPSTVPIQSAATLFEINADSSHCGFGWTRDSGIGRVFAMTESANCARIDFYVSDLQAGVGGPLDIVSPNRANSIDSGALGIVPAASWRSNGFSDPQLDPQVPVVAYDTAPYTYHIYTQITTQPCYIGCYTAGDTVKRYALIQVDSANAESGRVWLQSWFQLVPGLRLMRH